MTKWIGTMSVAVIVALCAACAQQTIQPMPRIEDKIDRDAYNLLSAPARTLLS